MHGKNCVAPTLTRSRDTACPSPWLKPGAFRRFSVKNILGPQEEARPLKDFVQHTENLNIDILPNDDRYANVVKEMLNLVMSGVNSYKLLVDELAPLYDYIIFDTKPAVDDEIRQIMMAVKWVIIPMDAADDAIDGANNTMRFVKGCTRGNPNLTVAGIFFNAVNLRSSVAKDYIPQIREAWGELVFDTVIIRRRKPLGLPRG